MTGQESLRWNETFSIGLESEDEGVSSEFPSFRMSLSLGDIIGDWLLSVSLRFSFLWVCVGYFVSLDLTLGRELRL